MTSDCVIFHDYFAIRGGGERTVLTMAEALDDATLVTGYRTEETYAPESFPPRFVSLGIPAFLRTKPLKTHLIALSLAFALQRRRAKGFRVRLFSGVAVIFAAPAHDVGANILYCHTPPRFAYDKRDWFVSRYPVVIRPVANALIGVFDLAYRHALGRIGVILTNSENTRARIRHYLGRDSMVVHPPVDTDRFRWAGQADYYLSTARLTGLKRVDMVVEAFMQMPDRRLIVVSGGEQLDRLRQIARAHPNIEFRGWTSEKELIDLMGAAIATIYVPRDEDFGMSPVESMAAGKPVIGVNEGGLRETVVDGETGELLPPEFDTAGLVDAVRRMTPERAAKMRAACERQARKFDRAHFEAAMRALVAERKRQR